MEFNWTNPPFNITPLRDFAGANTAVISLDSPCNASIHVKYRIDEDMETHFTLSATDFMKIVKMTNLYTGEVGCPDCGKKEIRKNGKSYKGAQRYLCDNLECKRTAFTINSHQPIKTL